MTKTAAYNANEVAAVYMSLNRNDLLSQEEGGSKLGGDETLKNGFYGLSDPLNLRGVLEAFECGFSQGANKAVYKVRILNPTPQLETTLFNFYSEVFPSNMSTFNSFKTASEHQQRMISVEGAVGTQDETLLANDAPPMLPSFYLRWGYGTDADSGLSRIHQARVSDIKYFVNDKEDKVIELYAEDMFYHWKSNPEANKRPYSVTTLVSDEADGQLSLRKPSEILTEILTDYLKTYAECTPAVDVGSYTDSFDNVVYSLAKALARGDAISKLNKLREAEGIATESTGVPAPELTAEEVKAFEDLLDRPLITTKSIDRSVIGNVTPQILYQAFKMVFESIGLKWEMNPVGTPPPVTGPLSLQQTTGANTDPETALENETDAVTNLNTYKVNIKSDWLQTATEARYTHVSSVAPTVYDRQYRLSFWPMVLENGNIRPLTTEEKHANPHQRIWLNAGMVNSANYKAGNNVDDDPNFKFSFNMLDLSTKFDIDKVLLAQQAVKRGFGDSAIPFIPVCVPPNISTSVAAGYFNEKTTPLVGNQDSVSFGPLQGCAPILDVNATNFFELDLLATTRIPKRSDMSYWVGWAVALSATQADSDSALLKRQVENPPLVLLEPTAQTALFIILNAQNYQTIEQKQQEVMQKVVEALKKTAEKFTKFFPGHSKEARFRKFIDRYANASVTMGDDGENPHISSYLQTILNNINRLMVGKSSKMRIEQVQINGLSTEEKAMLTNTCTLLEGVTWEETWAKNNHSLLLCMPGGDMATQYGDRVIRPIKSFPQTYSVDVGNKYIWLDYGTPNSIVADVDFTGNQRVLLNLAQSNFSVRQWNDINQLFNGDNTISTNLLSNSISKMLEDKIATLNTTTQTDSIQSQQKRLTELERLKKLADNQSNMEIDVELLDILPELLDSYQVDAKTGEDDLSELEVISPNDAAQLRKLSSIMSNSKLLNMLFPTANVDGKTNEITTEVLMVKDGKAQKVIKKGRILRRRIDLDSVRSRISEEERSAKMTDVAANYSIAMQQESFNLKITTLGIPEIDDPASEYLSRRVCFKFYDPRLGNGQLHWMSGVYQITGFRHKINPQQGFLTELEMVKLPKESLSNIRDIRDAN